MQGDSVLDYLPQEQCTDRCLDDIPRSPSAAFAPLQSLASLPVADCKDDAGSRRKADSVFVYVSSIPRQVALKFVPRT